jgi:spore maturation protein CgeB
VRILYVAMKHDYGRPEQGLSFEHCNFYDSLVHMGCDILYFDFMALTQQHGRDWMNRRLVEVAAAEKPDLLFCCLMEDELDRKTMRRISDGGQTLTLNWFCDDQRRFEDFSRHWAPCFNWVVTTAAGAPEKYERIGYRNAIKSQWACNHFMYRKLDLPLKYDVTFVGLPHGDRPQMIQGLRDAGIDVKVWGQGWESGRLSQEEMIRVFNQSRINLNLSNAAVVMRSPAKRAKRSLRKAADAVLSNLPMGEKIGAAGRKVLRTLRGVEGKPAAQGQAFVEQIKGRNFEVPGCGGFLLTGQAENLGDYYLPGREVACFDGQQDLVTAIRHYLQNEGERASIAQAGYVRTLRGHTYVHRFREIFRRLGLPVGDTDGMLKGTLPPGRTEEVV